MRDRPMSWPAMAYPTHLYCRMRWRSLWPSLCATKTRQVGDSDSGYEFVVIEIQGHVTRHARAAQLWPHAHQPRRE